MSSHLRSPRQFHMTSFLNTPLETPAAAATSSDKNSFTPSPIPPSPMLPTQSPRGISIVLLHPSTEQVLQRVEAESYHDVETYVQIEGNKKYASVKEAKREQLLHRAKRERGIEQLDDRTVRKQTNLASAKASRDKKKHLLDVLLNQLKKKSQDAEILAREIRRMVFSAEQLEIHLRQQSVINSCLLQRIPHVQNPASTDRAYMSAPQRLFAFSCEEDDANYRTSGLHHSTTFEENQQLDDTPCMTPTDAQQQLYTNSQGQDKHAQCASMAEIKPGTDESVDANFGFANEIGTSWKASDPERAAQLEYVQTLLI